MGKVIRLTESDLYRIVKRVMTESGMAAEQGLSEEQKEMIKSSLNREDLRFLKMMLNKYGKSQLRGMMIDVLNGLTSGGGVGVEKPGRPDVDDTEQMSSMNEDEDMDESEKKMDIGELSEILQKVVGTGILASFVAVGADFPTVGVVTFILTMIPMAKLFKMHDY